MSNSRSMGRGRSLPWGWRSLIIGLLVVGIFFRFYNLDKKVYWIDETNSSLRTLGYTRTEMIETVFTGQALPVADLQQYQQLRPDKNWGDTLTALTGTAEHAPLYFLIARFWIGLVGHSIAAMRGVAALFGVLLLGCLFWFCHELFTDRPAVAWVAVALVAVSPLQVLYAQEARPYSLLSAIVLLSSTLLLRALRATAPRSARRWWWGYALTLMLGLYTQLLFVLVILAHGIYVWVMEKAWITRWRSPQVRAYLLATALSFLAFTPWIGLFIYNLDTVRNTTQSLTSGYPLGYMLDRWCLNVTQGLLDRELAAANLLVVIAVGLVLFYLCRHAPKRSWVLLLALVGSSFLGLALPDLIFGGRASLRIRYLFPFFLGLQIAIAYFFATQALWVKTGWQQIGRLLLIGLLVNSLVVCSLSSQATVWWNKSITRSAYYPIVAERVNQSPNPLLLSADLVTDVLALSYWLEPTVQVMLALEPKEFKLRQTRNFESLFLLSPSEGTKKLLRRRGYELTLLYEDTTDPTEVIDRLWAVTPPPD